MKNCKIFRRSICAVLSAALIFAAGCTDKSSESGSENSESSQIVLDVDTEKMPEIVFMKYKSYNKYASGCVGYHVYFIDNNGNVYNIQEISEDTDNVLYYSTAQICEDFKSGKLDDKKSEKSCDKSELDENFGKLCEVCSDENYSMAEPDSMPDVESDSAWWAGFYYNKNGDFRQITLHRSECSTGIDSNNETANEIYRWFNGILTN